MRHAPSPVSTFTSFLILCRGDAFGGAASRTARSSSNTAEMSGCFLASRFKLRSKAAVDRTRKAAGILGALTDRCFLPLSLSLQLCKKLAGITHPARFRILAAFRDLFLHLRIT